MLLWCVVQYTNNGEASCQEDLRTAFEAGEIGGSSCRDGYTFCETRCRRSIAESTALSPRNHGIAPEDEYYSLTATLATLRARRLNYILQNHTASLDEFVFEWNLHRLNT